MAGESDASTIATLSCVRCEKPAHLQYVITLHSLLLPFYLTCIVSVNLAPKFDFLLDGFDNCCF